MNKGFLSHWRRAAGTKSEESAKTQSSQKDGSFMRFLPVLVFFAFGLIVGCGGGGGDGVTGGGSGTGTTPLPDPVTRTLTPEEGGLLVLSNGSSLEIPPDALFETTTITISAIDKNEEGLIGGLIFEPTGLVFNRPAFVSVYLPQDWAEDDLPVVYQSKSADPLAWVPRGDFANVEGLTGNLVAEAPIYSFSSLAFAVNCHAGTIKRVFENFNDRGCSKQTVIDQVSEQYPSVDFNNGVTESANQSRIQAFLDNYFDDIGGWDPGDNVDPAVWAGTLEAFRSGKQVVLAFSGQPWSPRGGPNNFYSAAAFTHTATLELQGDEIVIFNTANFGPDHYIREHFETHYGDQEVWFTWPAEDLDGFRSSKHGVGLEIMICGQADCLSSVDKNVYNLDPYKPLNGFRWYQSERWQVADPGPRPVANPAVRIYIERAEANENPCEPNDIVYPLVFTGSGTSTDCSKRLSTGNEGCCSNEAEWRITLTASGGLYGRYYGVANPQAVYLTTNGFECRDYSSTNPYPWEINFKGQHDFKGNFTLVPSSSHYYDYHHKLFLYFQTEIMGKYNKNKIFTDPIYSHSYTTAMDLELRTIKHEFDLPRAE